MSRAVFLALLLSPLALHAEVSEIIAVGIARNVSRIEVTTHGKFSVIDQATGEMKQLKAGKVYVVEGDAGKQVVFGPHLFMGPLRLLPGGADEYVTINNRRYNGNLVFQANADETITVIDEIDIEDYLLGVLPKEMSPSWPLEALKAQAVVARTFALNNLGKFSEKGYDLRDDSMSQMYGGAANVSLRVRRAVKETRGQTLSYAGKRLPVYFHSSCGGHTTDPKSVWGGSGKTPRPLRGVRDRYCRLSPHQNWKAYFRTSDILRTLQEKGFNNVRLDQVRKGSQNRSGYLKNFQLRLDRAWRTVSANTLRLWLGASELKSVRIQRIRRRRKGYEFRGRGYGHGVGLCQWGSRAQAQRGHDYETILAFYFPGARMRLEAALR